MKKKFDSVKFQRDAREKLSKEYNSDRDAFLRELREKYYPIMTGIHEIHDQLPKTLK
jgi:hypothetical protein